MPLNLAGVSRMPLPPAIPGYELSRRLGGGLLTDVFAARRIADGQPAAIKVPRAEWADHADAIRLLRREARALGIVRHANIVRLIEARLPKPPFFLALELLDGESLRARLRRDFRLAPRDALWIARQVAEGLQAAHGAGFVHGDIKPDNLQLGSSGRALLLDFGFAHQPGTGDSWRDEGYLLGTVDYLAPEQLGGGAEADFSTDWYAFGLVLFEMLTGRLPHAHRADSELIDRRADPDSVPAVMNPKWPPRLANLIAGLLAHTPAHRPRGNLVVHELLALEIAALASRRAG